MKNIIHIILLAGLGWALSSCDLNKEPKSSIRYEDTFKTMADAAKFRNGLYTTLRNVQLGSFSYAHDLTSDLFNAADGYGNNWGPPHRLDAVMLTSGNVSAVWSSCYGELKHVNNFLDKIDLVEQTDPANATDVALYKAEAHYIRAYLYYQLIKHYGVDYEPEGSEKPTVNAPGVPLVITYDTEERPVRATLGEIYNFIITELELAEAYGQLPIGTRRSKRITIDALKALKSKVLLCMHDYEGAAKIAEELINGGLYTLVASASALLAGWRDDNWNEDILLLNVSSTESCATNDYFAQYSTATATYAPLFLPSKKLVDMFDGADQRLTCYLSNPETEQVLIAGNRHRDVKFLKKWPRTTLYTPGSYSYRHAPKVARIAEQYLILAEAKLHSNKPEALAWLIRLRTARGANNSSDIVNITNVETAIQDEWAREFCGEGMRIECLKRWHLGFNGREPQKASIVVGGADDNTREYIKRSCPPDYYRFTFPVPIQDVRSNPNIKQTPEWVNPQ